MFIKGQRLKHVTCNCIVEILENGSANTRVKTKLVFAGESCNAGIGMPNTYLSCFWVKLKNQEVISNLS